MAPEKRRAAILELANQKAELTVEQIADSFGVSRETARRDLAHLDAKGLLRRVHGGALRPQTASEANMTARMEENADVKRRIATAAARLFQENDTLMIDTGSTTAFLAAALANVGRLTVITNSVTVAGKIYAGGQSRVYLIGGEFNGGTGETLGSASLDQISRFRADHAVLTIGAIDPQGGFMDYDLEEAMVARAMIQQSTRVTVVADGSKFGRIAMAKVCEFSQVDRLVTGTAPPDPFLKLLRAAGVELIVAE